MLQNLHFSLCLPLPSLIQSHTNTQTHAYPAGADKSAALAAAFAASVAESTLIPDADGKEDEEEEEEEEEEEPLVECCCCCKDGGSIEVGINSNSTFGRM